MVLLDGPTGWWFLISEVPMYRCTSLRRERPPLGPYNRPIYGPQVLLGRGGRFRMSEVPLWPVKNSVPFM